MREYDKPVVEFIELRPEEGLANNGSANNNCASGSQVCVQPSHDNPNNPT